MEFLSLLLQVLQNVHGLTAAEHDPVLGVWVGAVWARLGRKIPNYTPHKQIRIYICVYIHIHIYVTHT